MADSTEEKRIRALEGRDASRFLDLSEELGLSGDEDPFLIERGEAERIWQERAQERLVIRDDKLHGGNFNYGEFGAAVKRDGNYRPEDIFYRTEDKTRLLEDCGLTRLVVGKGESVKIRDASVSRGGLAFRNQVRTYERIISSD